MPGFRGLAAGPGSPRAATPAPLCSPVGHGGTAGRAAKGEQAPAATLRSTSGGVGGLGGAADGARGAGEGPRTAALSVRLPGSPHPRPQGAPRLGTGRARRGREEAGRRGNNVVGCFADCQPRSRILLSTPLGLTATGPARRGKSPLIWSWKERGKVILRCLRRWVIGPQLLARTRLRRRLPPVGGGVGQRLLEAPEVVNKPGRLRHLRLGVSFCVRAGRGAGVGWCPEAGLRRRRGRRRRGPSARRGQRRLFFFKATVKPWKWENRLLRRRV